MTKTPLIGETLRFDDGVSPVRTIQFTNDNGTTEDRPKDNKWYVQTTNGGSTVAGDRTTVRDALLSKLQTMKTDGYLLMTSTSNGSDRILTNPDVPGTQGNVALPDTDSDAFTNVDPSGGTGTPTSVSLTAVVA